MLGKFKTFFKRYIVKEKITPIKIPIFQGKMLENKCALIIGGSGGIGYAIAKHFVSNACRVIITGTKDNKLSGLSSSLGENCDFLSLDLKNVASFKDVVDKSVNKLGKIDILVNAAGVHCKDKFGNISEEEWDKVIDTNLKGVYFMSQEVANYMISNNIKGHILNVGSASCAKPGWTPYEISKCAVKSLTLGMADKLIKHGIVVNSIAPGPVATQMLGKENDDDLRWNGNPTGRMAPPEEIANLAVLMASDLGNLIVGDTYFISGGSGTVCIDK